MVLNTNILHIHADYGKFDDLFGISISPTKTMKHFELEDQNLKLYFIVFNIYQYNYETKNVTLQY